jgi:mannose/fructose/N-acetylgalactosamine-specific phosphotransferase system component IID
MRLNFTRFVKIFFATLFIQTSWSFSARQGMGFLFSLLSGASRDKKEDIVKSHRGYFNTHPYMASYIIGATLRAYDEGKASTEEIKRFITIAQTSFASVGDLLFWETIRPVLLLIAVILGMRFGLLGPIAFLVAFNIIHLYHRATGILDGYRMGWDVINQLRSKRFVVTQQVFEIVGALASGLLIFLIELRIGYLLIVPITLLFILLIAKRLAAVYIVLAVLLLLIIIILV